jgi:hypothetical protein
MDNPRKWLSDQAKFLRFASSLLGGWVIEPDHRTGNLLVHDGKRGFAVIGLCLRSWPMKRIAADVSTACNQIVNGGQTKIATVFPLQELRAQANQPTQFDKEPANEAH